MLLTKDQVAELRQFVIGAASPPVTRDELHSLCDTAERGLEALAENARLRATISKNARLRATISNFLNRMPRNEDGLRDAIREERNG